MRNDNEYIRIDLVKIFEGLIQRVWTIVMAMLLCGAIMFSYATFWLDPLYESSALMYVNNSSFSVGATNFSISSSEITAAKSLVDTYLVILQTRSTLEDVIDKAGLDLEYEELLEMVRAESVNETEVFSVTVTSTDPQLAEHIANTIAYVLPGKIADIVEGSSVRIVDYAVVPSEKVSPSIRLYTLVGLILGLLISGAVIVVIEIMDDQIRSEEYLLENFKEIPLLTAIPDLLDERHKGYNYYYYYEQPDEKDSRGKNSRRRENW